MVSSFVYYCGSKHRGVFQGTINGSFLFLLRKLNIFNHSFRSIPFLLMTSPLSFRLEVSQRSRFSNSPFGIFSGLLLLGGRFNNSVSPMLAFFVYMFFPSIKVNLQNLMFVLNSWHQCFNFFITTTFFVECYPSSPKEWAPWSVKL